MGLTDVDRARDALLAIPPDLPREEWVRAAMAAKAAGLSFEDFDEWSSRGSSYRADAARNTWRSIRDGGGIGAGTLFRMARDAGWQPSASPRPHQPLAPAAAPRQRLDQQPRYERLSEFGHELWNACRPLAGEARAYLEARACVVPPADGGLRWHPALKHPPSGFVGPALVALVTDVLTGVPLTLHRTWISADGSKAPVDPPRMLLGGHRKQGGVVRLWPDEAVTTGLGVAEGVETGLAMAHAMTPVWSCIDAGNLAALPVLGGIEALTIAADHDEAGIKAAEVCAGRWAAAGRGAWLVLPERQKTDLNDVARAA